jgi:toxin ParE1/3/4
VSEGHYVIRPKADRDLEDLAYRHATEASPAVGRRFLVAAHATFTLLAIQPHMGWQSRLKSSELKLLRVFRVTGFERILILYLPLPEGIEILRVIHGSRNLHALLHREGLG